MKVKICSLLILLISVTVAFPKVDLEVTSQSGELRDQDLRSKEPHSAANEKQFLANQISYGHFKELLDNAKLDSNVEILVPDNIIYYDNGDYEILQRKRMAGIDDNPMKDRKRQKSSVKRNPISYGHFKQILNRAHKSTTEYNPENC